MRGKLEIVKEGVKLGKRVALVQMARTQRSMGPNGAEPGVARQAANRMALLRNSIGKRVIRDQEMTDQRSKSAKC